MLSSSQSWHSPAENVVYRHGRMLDNRLPFPSKTYRKREGFRSGTWNPRGPTASAVWIKGMNAHGVIAQLTLSETQGCKASALMTRCRHCHHCCCVLQVFGVTPFRGVRRDETFENVIRAPLQFPPRPQISPECQDLISKLLVKDPAQRLGTKTGEAVGARGSSQTRLGLEGSWGRCCRECIWVKGGGSGEVVGALDRKGLVVAQS